MMRALMVLWLLVLLGGCDRPERIVPSGKSVVVDVIAPMHGRFRSYGEQTLRGLEGGRALSPLLPNGDAVKLRLHDDNSSAAQARAQTEAFGSDAMMLISLAGSDTVLGMAETITRLKLPTMAVIATQDTIPEASVYLTRLGIPTGVEAQIAASYVRDELYVDRAGVLYDGDNVYFKALSEGFVQRYEAIGGRIVGRVRADEIDDPAKMAVFRRAQILYASVGAEALVRAIPLLRKAGFRGTLFLTDGLLAEMRSVKPGMLGKLDGALIIDHFANDMRLDPQGKRFKRYLEDKSYVPTTFAGLGFEAYRMLYKALSECPGYAKTCLGEHLRNSGPVEGIASVIQSREGAVQRPVYVNRIEGAKMLRQVKVY